MNSDDRVPSAADYQIIPFPDGGSDECCPRTSALTEPCAVCYTTEPYVVVPYQIHGVGLEPTISPQSGANAGYRPAALAAMLPVEKWSARCESNARGGLPHRLIRTALLPFSHTPIYGKHLLSAAPPSWLRRIPETGAYTSCIWRRRDSNSHLLGADQPCYRSHYAPEKPPLRIERRSENYEFSVLPLNYGGMSCPPRDSNTHPRGRNSRFCPIELGGQ